MYRVPSWLIPTDIQSMTVAVTDLLRRKANLPAGYIVHVHTYIHT